MPAPGDGLIKGGGDPSARAMDANDSIRSYYRDPRVRRRILEFLGGDRLENLTCHFITADDASTTSRTPVSPKNLFACLDRGMEIARSLWDEESLLADIDIEYVNFDFPAEAYLNPQRTFAMQEPVARETKRQLARYGIDFLHTLTGRGHHVVWRIPFESAALSQIEEIGREVIESSDPSRDHFEVRGVHVPPSLQRAFAGLALVMEYLACEIRRRSAPSCTIPVELTAVEAGPSEHGREIVSIDLSEYGDPLSTRAVRIPFSVYLKPWQHRQETGETVVQGLPPIFALPRGKMPFSRAIEAMRDANLAAEWAAKTSAKIPLATGGMTRLVKEYLTSPLRRFHEWFHSHRQHPPEMWPATYDRLPLENLPSCVQLVLTQPNDLLLKPAGMRLVTRVMLALGWHPRHIAGLIRSKFERDHGWGDQWRGYDPKMRADFYTRIFSGPFVSRCDDLVDFNCQSSKEEKTCPFVECAWNLERFRDSVLARRRHEHLAHRPFNRLFLPTKHL